MHDVLVRGEEHIRSFIVGATGVKAGQVVAYPATGVTRTVIPAVHGTTGQPVGVALYDQTTGYEVAVACRGAWAKVANADNTTAIDAGDPVEDNDNAVGGTVAPLPIAGSGTVAQIHYCVGYAVDVIAGGGTGIIEVAPGIITQPNAS